MIPEFLIMFRESLEAALIVGIILGYLMRTKQQRYNNTVYIGIAAGIVGSIVGAIIFILIAGGFEGRAEQIFEGITMLIGAFLLTTMILWMMKQKHATKELEAKVENETSSNHKLGLFLLVFFSILREGIETVIFLGAASFVSKGSSIIGAIAGLAFAVALGYALFVLSMRVDIKKFFNISSALLIIFAAGLVGHGVHEFEEAKILPPVVEHVYDINPAQNHDGSYPAMHEKGFVGQVLKGLLGYNGNPSLLELISYFGYIVLVYFLYRNIRTAHKAN